MHGGIPGTDECDTSQIETPLSRIVPAAPLSMRSPNLLNSVSITPRFMNDNNLTVTPIYKLRKI